jgi:hypothetical protein
VHIIPVMMDNIIRESLETVDINMSLDITMNGNEYHEVPLLHVIALSGNEQDLDTVLRRGINVNQVDKVRFNV